MKIKSYRAQYINDLTEEQIREKEQLFQESMVNEAGQILEETTYSSEGEIESKYIFAYNDKGSLTKEIIEDPDGEIASCREMEYDDQNRLLKEYFHYGDLSDADVTHCYYDENGLLIRKELINSDDELETLDEYEYQNGKLVSEIQRDSSKKVKAEKRFTYDANGNLIEENINWFNELYRQVHQYGENKELELTKKYNTRNQLMERYSFTENDKKQVVAVKEETVNGIVDRTYEYDEAGNIVLQEEREASGNLRGKIQRTYEGKNLQSIYVYAGETERQHAQEYRIRYEYE